MWTKGLWDDIGSEYYSGSWSGSMYYIVSEYEHSSYSPSGPVESLTS